MQDLRGSTYNQLTLLDQFDKNIKRDERLVSELIKALLNFKYFKVNTRFSEIHNKADIEKELNNILYWVAFLSWKKSRYVPEYKDNWNLEFFLAKTKEASHVNVTEYLEPDTLSEYYQNGHRRLKSTFMVYKDLLVDERTITKRILDSFDNIHGLTHAIQSTKR